MQKCYTTNQAKVMQHLQARPQQQLVKCNGLDSLAACCTGSGQVNQLWALALAPVNGRRDRLGSLAKVH